MKLRIPCRRVTATRVESMCAARSKLYMAVLQTAAVQNVLTH